MTDLETLYPIADALQLQLLYNKELGVISGKRLYNVELLKGFEFSFKLEVKASYVSKKLSAVMVRVVKNLYLYVVHSISASETTLYIINAEGTKLTSGNMDSIHGVPPTNCIKNLEKNIVAMYVKPTFGISWELKTNVKNMDARHETSSKPVLGEILK